MKVQFIYGFLWRDAGIINLLPSIVYREASFETTMTISFMVWMIGVAFVAQENRQ